MYHQNLHIESARAREDWLRRVSSRPDRLFAFELERVRRSQRRRRSR
jgi:hypothetical protein